MWNEGMRPCWRHRFAVKELSMITTITTSTVSSITSIAGLSVGLAFIAVVCLVFFLIQKETLTASITPSGRALARALNVAIVPLLLGFGMIILSKMLELFN